MELRKHHYLFCNNTIILKHLILNINKNQYAYNNSFFLKIKIKIELLLVLNLRHNIYICTLASAYNFY